MGYIYLITNKINNKKYIGKTTQSIRKRWQEHIKDSKKEKCEIRPLYRAIRKYGVENFSIKQVEKCNVNILSEREQYWIQYYDTYKKGYNATIGGDSSILYDHDGVIQKYLALHSIQEVADVFKCHRDTVHNILIANDIPITSGNIVNSKKTSKPIFQYTKDGKFIKEYPSAMEAARQIGGEQYMPNISRCANGKRKTANKYVWRWKE